MRYYFDWNPNKARTNLKKHGIGFEEAATIFLDPGMISVFDAEHSGCEDRWATIGFGRNGALLVAVHTFQQLDANCCSISRVLKNTLLRQSMDGLPNCEA